jgi:hypothetical protein
LPITAWTISGAGREVAVREEVGIPAILLQGISGSPWVSCTEHVLQLVLDVDDADDAGVGSEVDEEIDIAALVVVTRARHCRRSRRW